MRPRRKLKSSRPDRSPAEDLLHRMKTAASAEGTSLGEWLYDALGAEFDFTGRWGAAGKADTRSKYSGAAHSFAARLAAVLADEPS